MGTAFKLVRPDGRTRNDFRWPLTAGQSVRSDDRPVTPDDPYMGDTVNDGVCPLRPGDGLSVAHTARGLRAAGFTSPTLLTVDTSQGSHTLIEDCSVCCRPIQVEVDCSPGSLHIVSVEEL